MTDLPRALAELGMRLPAGTVSTREADRLGVSTDLSPRHLVQLYKRTPMPLPAAVVWPDSTAAVQTVVLWARQHSISLVPFGAGSSVVGGAWADPDQVVVDLKRMQRLVALDGRARTATAEAGIIGELLERRLEREGFTQGHFPSSIYCSSLGGWIAGRGAGQMSSRYGKIEDQVLGGTVVLGDGSLVRQEPNPVRSGLWSELIGSEGVLGFWTEATVRIHPLPEQRRWRGLLFPSLAAALGASRAWLAAGISPAVIRIYDPLDSLLHKDIHGEHVRKDKGPSQLAWLGAHLPRLTSLVADTVGGACRCIVGVQGSLASALAQMEEVLAIGKDHGGQDRGVAAGEAWYERRYAVSYKQSNALRAGVMVDTMEVACTWDTIRPTYEAVRAASLGVGAQVLAHFSHLYIDGGSIYFTFAFPAEGGEQAYERLWRAALGAAVTAGANVSHHHGVGRLKTRELARTLGSAAACLRELRSEYDPSGILNPRALAIEEHPHPPTRERQESLEGFVCTAAPGESVSALEERLNRRDLTLGEWSSLLGSWQVGELGRRGWLWRFDPQLRIIGPALAGVDARIDGTRFWTTPAPRAAMGPDLRHRLLRHDVQRLWLRCLPLRKRSLLCRGPWESLLEVARLLQGDEIASGAVSTLRSLGADAVLSLWMPQAESAVWIEKAARTFLRAFKVDRVLGEPPIQVFERLEGEPIFVAGPWTRLSRFLTVAMNEGHAFSLPWVDPVGAAGFVHRRNYTGLDAESDARLRALARELALTGEMERQPPQELPSLDSVKPEAVRKPEPAATPVGTRLRLFGARAQLDNCTYCPKLCRFSCPVAVADGSETLTPRQLMLSVNLDSSGRRSLSRDGARRLWACTDCGGCQSFCDHGNDVAAVLTEARTELVAALEAPEQVQAVLEALQEAGRLPDRPSTDDVAPLLDSDDGAPTLLFLGCQNGRADIQTAQATAALVRRRYGAVQVAAGPLSCCGHPLWRWGDREGFRNHAQAMVRQWDNVQRIVVDDPGCSVAIAELYPRVGVAVPEVVNLRELLAGERFAVAEGSVLAPMECCHGGNGSAGAPLRRLLSGQAVLSSGSVLEGEAGCCGGMLLPFYDPELAVKVARQYAEDLSVGATGIVASSPTCRRRLRAAGANVVDVMDLLLS